MKRRSTSSVHRDESVDEPVDSRYPVRHILLEAVLCLRLGFVRRCRVRCCCGSYIIEGSREEGWHILILLIFAQAPNRVSVVSVYSRAPPRVDCRVAALTAPRCRPPALRLSMRKRCLPSWPIPPPPGPHWPARRPRGPSFVAAASIALSPYPQPVRSGSSAAAVSTSLLLQRL